MLPPKEFSIGKTALSTSHLSTAYGGKEGKKKMFSEALIKTMVCLLFGR
jgi:hypothetical protein